MSHDIREKMWKAMADSPIVMLGLTDSNEHREPMHAQLDKDANSAFWFYTTKTNRNAAGGKAMANTGAVVNIKKPQFLSPEQMTHICLLYTSDAADE